MEFEQGVGYIDMKPRPEKIMQLWKKLVDKNAKLDFTACAQQNQVLSGLAQSAKF